MVSSTNKYLCGIFALTSLASGCGADPSPFTLQFAATVNGAPVSCAAEFGGLGPAKQHTVGISDLRFYVSNLQFKDSAGNPVALKLDDNEFQLNDPAGTVALIDLTGNTEGSCGQSAIAFAEGTARTNTALRGSTVVENVASISFEVGVPQAVMKSVIAVNTAESAPSPLNEMYWSWASGYRHFVFNFAARDAMQNKGGGYLHVGSRNCGPPDGRALKDRESCEFVNTPKFSAASFDLRTNKISVDLGALVAGLDFIAPIYDPKTFEVIGQGVGAECHSAPSQPDCPFIFANLGVDMTSGGAQATGNRVFSAVR